MSKRDEMYNNDAVWAAFYRDGKNLRDIAKEFGCSIYDLSPWLISPIHQAIMQDVNHRKNMLTPDKM